MIYSDIKSSDSEKYYIIFRYCFHCHTGGEVVLCSDCHRVYHEACLKEPVKPALESLTQEAFLCSYCKAFQVIVLQSLS